MSRTVKSPGPEHGRKAQGETQRRGREPRGSDSLFSARAQKRSPRPDWQGSRSSSTAIGEPDASAGWLAEYEHQAIHTETIR